MRVFYGWWIVMAAFLNLFFSVGILYYGFPVFYPSMVDSLGFTRSQLTQGFLIGFVVAALLFGILAGALIDRLGAPDLSTARLAAEEEVAFTHSLCTHPVSTLIAVHRSVADGEIREEFRALRRRESIAHGRH